VIDLSFSADSDAASRDAAARAVASKASRGETFAPGGEAPK
jgi:hypothetical protein